MHRCSLLAGTLTLTEARAALTPTPTLRRRGATGAPLLAAEGAAEGTPAPAQAAWRLGDELDQRIASLALPAVVSFMILPIAQATDLLGSGLG